MYVGDLLDASHLGIRLLTSDRDALGRTLRWTFTTDLPDPSRYIAGGELVITGLDGGARPTTAKCSFDRWPNPVRRHWPRGRGCSDTFRSISSTHASDTVCRSSLFPTRCRSVRSPNFSSAGSPVIELPR